MIRLILEIDTGDILRRNVDEVVQAINSGEFSSVEEVEATIDELAATIEDVLGDAVQKSIVKIAKIERD